MLAIPDMTGVDYISLVSRTGIGDIPVTLHRTVATTSRPKKPYFLTDASETFDKCPKTGEVELTWTVFGANEKDQDQVMP
nr:unnamed protein product [Spirometra erinaceieuropaei]